MYMYGVRVIPQALADSNPFGPTAAPPAVPIAVVQASGNTLVRPVAPFVVHARARTHTYSAAGRGAPRCFACQRAPCLPARPSLAARRAAPSRVARPVRTHAPKCSASGRPRAAA